jgi:CheY-like chemotaxis protein
MQNVDLNQAVGEIDDLLRRLVGARMRFSIGIQPDLGLVYADAGQLHQVIMNLCVNARDATPNGGKIELSITNLTLKPGQLTGRPPDAEDLAPGDYVRIAVTDNGAGIPEEVKGRIFEPFFSTKSVNEGTGLGLSVVKGIVEQSAGLITVNSVLAQGTTFAIYLPRVIGVAGNTADSAPKPIPQGTGTILLVEDEDLVRSAIARVLKRAGYTILVASSPSDAMAICTTQGSDIDLILTDVVMPEMTGIEMIETIRKTHPAIGTIFMSGYPGDEIARDGSFDEHGMLLQKPVNPQELISYIQSILDGPPTDKINDKNKRTT